MGQFFGTDGIRGEAGRSPLTAKEVWKIGRAAGRVLKSKINSGPIRVVIVRDTRASGPSLLKNLSDGLREEGVHVYDAGVLCTPAVALLVKTHKFQSGVVISASHNPPEFNGVKFFSAQSRKWPDEWEGHVEKILLSKKKDKRGPLKGEMVPADSLADDYAHFLIESLGAKYSLNGLRIAVDCANGANYKMAPTVLTELGAEVFTINHKPTGRNINVDCGSQHTHHLSKLVRKKKCDVGVAFDGDGDRVVFVDEKGHELDGDYLIALLAKVLKQKGRLRKNTVVATVMANIGFRKAVEKMGLRILTTPVGDRHVSDAMRKHGAVLGGEQSGHIILGEYLPTGDGLLTALHVLAAIKESKKPLSKMVGFVKKFPQVLFNLRVKERIPLESMDGVASHIRTIEKTLGSNGRVLVRYSGTEPLLRIMLEGPDEKKLNAYAQSIANLVKRAQ
jgi:phosphoglucosamine mutase